MWEVVGQPKAVRFLEQGLQDGLIAHAYVFSGPPQIGKRTIALNLAQAINCEGEERPCHQCRSCRRIEQGKHADVKFLGLSTGEHSNGKQKKEIGIDIIRDIQHDAGLRPFEGQCKVFIIDRADILTTEASNCLLKTLEEPPAHVYIVLLTENERLLLPTVLSRCQKIQLAPLPIETVERTLVQRWSVEEEQAKRLARLSRGRLGWAVQASCDDKVLVERAARLDSLIALNRVGPAERFSYALELARQFGRDRQEVRASFDLWMEWWRDLLLVGGGASEFVTDSCSLDILQEESRHYTLLEIKGIVDRIRLAWRQLEQNANPRLVLEVLMLDLPTSNRGVPGRHNRPN